MAERWETVNQLTMPVDWAFGAGLEILKKIGIYEHFKDNLYDGVRAFQRANFERDNDLEIVGLENVPETGGALLAPNHQSWLDVQVIVASCERRVTFVAKAMFEKWPMLRHLIELSSSLYVRRGGDADGLKAVVDALKDGQLVCIFPEGTIPGEENVARWEVEPDTGLLRGKSGVVRLAIEAGVPVIPVGLSGTGAAFPPEAYPRMQQLPLPKKEKITIRYGEPIRFDAQAEKVTRAALRKMTKTVMRAISALIDHERGYVPLRLPLEPKTRPGRIPPYALRSKPTTRKAKAPLGVLVLHGFTSHISCVDPIRPLLDERELPYRFPLLRGHGTRPEDLAGATAAQWYEDAEDALLDLLGECKKVVVIGHSMGGAVALDLAARHGDQLAGVIPVAPALCFADPMTALSPLLSRLVGFWPSPNAYHDPECAKKNRNYERFPTDAFASLHRYATDVTNVLSFVKVPTIVIHARKDQVVAPRSADVVAEKVDTKDCEVVWFEKSGHEMFLDMEGDAVVAAVGEALDKLRKK